MHQYYFLNHEADILVPMNVFFLKVSIKQNPQKQSKSSPFLIKTTENKKKVYSTID
jgi:hypothetical protein